MSRRELVRLLYLGGQAAITAEIVVVVGFFLLALAAPDISETRPQEGTKGIEELINAYRDHRVFFILLYIVVTMMPTFAMLFVMWSWHIYFAEEGIRLMHWVATSVGLIGAGLQVFAFSMNTWALSLAINALDEAILSVTDIYVGYIISTAIQLMASVLLYVFYPALLSLASWQKRLLPIWFLGVMLILGAINDGVLIFGSQDIANFAIIQVFTAVLPFMMGIILLRKAQLLAVEVYTETHGTPPPTPTSRFDRWLSPPESHQQTLSDETAPTRLLKFDE